MLGSKHVFGNDSSIYTASRGLFAGVVKNNLVFGLDVSPKRKDMYF